MYDARVVANAVLERAWQLDIEVTQIDIQKICYFLNGHYLIDHGEPLIETEFEAWQHGPVQRVLYTAFKGFGQEAISRLATSFDPIKRISKVLPQITSNSALATIDKYLPHYLGIPSFALVDMTHAANTPWTLTQQNSRRSANIGMRISSGLIRDNFEGVKVLS